MTEPLMAWSLWESFNPYPDCCVMDLEVLDYFRLTLTLQEQWFPLLGGRVRFGIKGGKIQLKLTGCEFYQPISSLEADFYPASASVREKFCLEKGDNLTWFLPSPNSGVIWQGIWRIKGEKVTIKESSPSLEAILALSLPDLTITDAEGLWRHDITPNQHGVLERAIAQFLLTHHLQSYLSRIILGSSPKISTPEKIGQDEEIRGLIDHLATAKTENFLELAQIAQLDPLKDFAGGNLRGSTLSGLDFAGANLAQVNLRGAVLTDIDFSEANLSGAKLGGADLSGAYLENVNLTKADLHSASLALANLIGADLRGANLKEVNLSNANLTSAEVEGAIFAHNSGISPDMQENLQERGAIFQ